MILTIKERVTAGATYLDSLYPGWANKINLEKLNMADSGNCLLAQLYNTNYFDICWVLSINDDQGIEYGFGIYFPPSSNDVYDWNPQNEELYETWYDQITFRMENQQETSNV